MAVIDASYKQLTDWLNDGTIQDHVALKDVLNVSYGNSIMPFSIEGFTSRICLVDGQEKLRNALNLWAVYITDGKVTYSSDGTRPPYSQSMLRDIITNTIQNSLDPIFVQCLANSKVLTYYAEFNSSSYITDVTYDKIYAPSLAQLGVTSGPSTTLPVQLAIEGPELSGLQNSTGIMRKRAVIGTPNNFDYYFLRTIFTSTDVGIWGIDDTGTISPVSGQNRVSITCDFIGSDTIPDPTKNGHILVPYNGTAKKANKILVPYNGTAKKATKCYVSQNGVAKLAWQVGG